MYAVHTCKVAKATRTNARRKRQGVLQLHAHAWSHFQVPTHCAQAVTLAQHMSVCTPAQRVWCSTIKMGHCHGLNARDCRANAPVAAHAAVECGRSLEAAGCRGGRPCSGVPHRRSAGQCLSSEGNGGRCEAVVKCPANKKQEGCRGQLAAHAHCFGVHGPARSRTPDCAWPLCCCMQQSNMHTIKPQLAGQHMLTHTRAQARPVHVSHARTCTHTRTRTRFRMHSPST